MNESTTEAASRSFYSALQEKAMGAVEGIINAQMYPVQYPAQGDFPWYWRNPNEVFNGKTLEYVDACFVPGVVPESVALQGSDTFPNNYTTVLNSLVYQLNSSDQEKMQAARTEATLQGGTVVTDYQSQYGLITDAQMTTAGVSTKLDYVIGYVLGTQWSGTGTGDGATPLSYSTMAGARNLRELLPQAPPSADGVINDVSAYLNDMAPGLAYEDLQQLGQWTLRQLKKNTGSPSATNGGMRVFDPANGSVSAGYRIGWSVNTPVQQISNDLKNLNRTITVAMDVESSSGGTLLVTVEDEERFAIGGPWLEFETVNAASYDMSRISGSSTQCSVSLTFAGYSVVSMTPAGWKQDTSQGFYSAAPIREAVENGTDDVTGFSFVSQPPFDFASIADGGNFGLLSNLLIANYPTVEITYRNANYSQFVENWSQTSSGNLSLFGFLNLGRHSKGVYQSTVQRGSDNSTFSVTFGPSTALVEIPDVQKTAFAVAAAIQNPGA